MYCCCLDFPLCFTFVLLLLFLFCSYFPILLLCPCSCLKHVVQYWIGVRGLLGVSWSPTIFPEPLPFCYCHLLALPCPATMPRLSHLSPSHWPCMGPADPGQHGCSSLNPVPSFLIMLLLLVNLEGASLNHWPSRASAFWYTNS